MLSVYFVLCLSCAFVSVIGSYSPFYYSFPQPSVYNSPVPFPAFAHHSSPFFAPLFNTLPTNHPQLFAYSSPNAIAPNLPSEDQASVKIHSSFGHNPYHGFIYRTNLGNEATSNVFFLAGSDAHQQEQIQNFIVTARNNMDNQITLKANVEKVAPEKLRSVSDIIDEVFGKQPAGFQYIYNSDGLPSVAKGRSLSDGVPLSQRFTDEDAKAKQIVKTNETSTTEESPENQKETTTEKKQETTTVVSSTTVQSSTNKTK